MGFSYYLIILKDEKIWNLYKLLLKKEFNRNNKDFKNSILVRILVIIKAILRDIYQLYNNILLDRKII